MPNDDTTSSPDTPCSRRQTPGWPFFGIIGAAVFAVAASTALVDAPRAQENGNVAPNCSDCAHSQPVRLSEFELRRRLDELARAPAEGRSFRIVNDAAFDLAAIGGEEALLEAYDYVVGRTGAALERLISLRVVPRDTTYCPPRGAAQWSPRSPGVTLYLSESADRKEVLGILAHEIGHIVQELGFPSGGQTGNGGFDQGFASWAAGRYWTDMLGFGSFAEAVASYRAAGTYIALISDPDGIYPFGEGASSLDSDAAASAACLAKRDIWFTVWAAFINHLDERFGRERLRALLRTNVNNPPVGWRPGELDFANVYGATLETLEADWLRAVDAQGVENASTAGSTVQ